MIRHGPTLQKMEPLKTLDDAVTDQPTGFLIKSRDPCESEGNQKWFDQGGCFTSTLVDLDAYR